VSENDVETTKTAEADGGPIIFVNQPETPDGWTADEVRDFRDFLRDMRPIWEAMDLPAGDPEADTSAPEPAS
jgi:hypothetical protein